MVTTVDGKEFCMAPYIYIHIYYSTIVSNVFGIQGRAGFVYEPWVP